MSRSSSYTNAAVTPRGTDEAGPRLDAAGATRIVRRWIAPDLTVSHVRKLTGGMVHRVDLWQTDGTPGEIVAKINTSRHADDFQRELAVLRWYRAHTDLPVPEPYTTFQERTINAAGLLMERILGPPLSEGRFSPRGVRMLQQELASHVATLHEHTRDTFGSALEPSGPSRWLEVFRPRLEREFHAVREQLGSRTRRTVDRVMGELDQWLPERATPTLVHGDLWATNVLVDDTHPDRPRILAFIDCGASYADPEYELAYLRLFQTADETFFSRYTQQHPLRPGFDRRCLIYWLNTMLVHVRTFGQRYVPACEDIANRIRRERDG